MGGSSAWSYLTDYLPWELGSSVGESHMMAAAEARGIWQRTAAKCHIVQENAILSPKVVHRSLPSSISKSKSRTCHPTGYSYYWSNSCFSPDSRLDLQRQFSANTHRDYRDSELDESLNTRFSIPAGLQSLAAESISNMKSGAGLTFATPDGSTANLELKGPFVIDPQSKSRLTAPTSELCKEDKDITFKDAEWCDTKRNGPEKEHPPKFGTVRTAANCSYNLGPQGPHYEALLNRQQSLASNVGDVFREISIDQERSTGSPIKSVFWQVADEEILAGHSSQRNEGGLDNCNLSCPEARLLTTVDCNPSMQEDQDVWQNCHRNIPSSPPCGSEFKHLEDIGQLVHSPSFCSLGPAQAEAWLSQRQSDPWTVPSFSGPPKRDGHHNAGSNYRNGHFSGEGAVTRDQGSGLFAEALCHSQTRAREAEKKVKRAFEEKERLMRLFLKEAYLAFTYRQWVASLQSENMWLKMSPRHQPVAWFQPGVLNRFLVLERFSGKRWKYFGQDYHSQYPMDQNRSASWDEKVFVYLGDPNDLIMGYTIAFALGFSLAGAGLVVGWSMGWILLAC